MSKITVEEKGSCIIVTIPEFWSRILSQYIKENKSINGGKGMYISGAANHIFLLKMKLLGYKQYNHTGTTSEYGTEHFHVEIEI